VDEPLANGRSQYRRSRTENARSLGTSGVRATTWSERTGTGLGKPSLALKDPICHLGRTGEEPSYKETKEREASRVTDGVVVCAGQCTNQEGSSPSGARMRGAISEGGIENLAGSGGSRTGQGVHREVESEGHEEKYRAVIEGEIPQMNRSAKDGARLSLHYEGESVTHPPIIPGCLRTARYGRFVRDPRRTCRVPVWQRDKRSYK